jgi:dienelactone hydrolase
MTQRTSILRFGALAVAVLFSLTVLSAEPIFENAEVVEFESVSYTNPPSPFKVKQAKKKGITLEPKIDPSIPLKGFLARPEGNGPFPAVVLMHTCAGISEHEESWSDRLVAWGYVVLTVDSFTPRGEKYMCGRQIITPWSRVLDAFGAKRYLSTRPFVDPTRIAVMGMSRGANAVLLVIKQSTSNDLAISPFRAAVVLYPWCGEPEPINTPTLILTGGEDTWTPADRCVQFLDRLPTPHEMTLQVFEGAHHGFDIPEIDIVEIGHIVRSDPAAAALAIQMAREFLNDRL